MGPGRDAQRLPTPKCPPTHRPSLHKKLILGHPWAIAARTASLDRLIARVDRVTRDLDLVIAHPDRLIARVDRVVADLDRLPARVDRLIGQLDR